MATGGQLCVLFNIGIVFSITSISCFVIKSQFERGVVHFFVFARSERYMVYFTVLFKGSYKVLISIENRKKTVKLLKGSYERV